MFLPEVRSRQGEAASPVRAARRCVSSVYLRLPRSRGTCGAAAGEEKPPPLLLQTARRGRGRAAGAGRGRAGRAGGRSLRRARLGAGGGGAEPVPEERPPRRAVRERPGPSPPSMLSAFPAPTPGASESERAGGRVFAGRLQLRRRS